jgi:accessory gene regulator protein AgrB
MNRSEQKLRKQKSPAHNTDSIICKLVSVFAFAPAPKTDF